MKRAVVTGGSGFLGRKLQAQLRNEGFSVTSIGRTELGDATQPVNWKTHLVDSQPTVIFHLMGTFHAPDEAAFDAAHWHPTLALMQALTDLAWNDIPLFLLGSVAEYGLVPNERQPISEAEIAQPVSAYGRSKLRVTEMARHSQLRVTVVRLFNVFAADMSIRLMPGAVLAQLGNEVIRTGPLDRIRDFLHADIAMQVLARLAQTDGNEKIINLCSGHGWNLREIVEILAQGKHPIIETPSASASDVRCCIGNNDRLASLIGYRPAIPTAEDFTRLLFL
ncbi:MAG: NAD(P)-dependent oxidoreductase [Chthoniobacterales bacterium]